MKILIPSVSTVLIRQTDEDCMKIQEKSIENKKMSIHFSLYLSNFCQLLQKLILPFTGKCVLINSVIAVSSGTVTDDAVHAWTYYS